MDNRGVAPVVEKTLAVGVVMLFVAGVTTTLFGGAVPAYRDAVGADVGERVLAMATLEVEQAVPPNATAVRSTRSVDLPSTIRGTGYEIRVDGRTLVLDHPDSAIGGRARPALPDSVDSLDGRWESGGSAVVTVHSVGDGLVVRLGEGTP